MNCEAIDGVNYELRIKSVIQLFNYSVIISRVNQYAKERIGSRIRLPSFAILFNYY